MERDIFEEKEEPQAKNLKNSRDKKTYGGRATDIDSIQNDKPNLSHRAYNLEKAEIGLKNIVRESSSKVEKLNLEEPRSNQISQSKLTFDDLFRTGQPLKDPSRVTAQNVSK